MKEEEEEEKVLECVAPQNRCSTFDGEYQTSASQMGIAPECSVIQYADILNYLLAFALH